MLNIIPRPVDTANLLKSGRKRPKVEVQTDINDKIKPLIVIKNPVRIKPLIYRKLYPEVTAEWLDKYFNHYLISGESSWREIPRRYWFRIDFEKRRSGKVSASKEALQQEPDLGAESWWDIRQLLLQITQCLNSSNMGNSYPQFPNDPFTRRQIPYDELTRIYHRAIELQLELHCSTLVLLYWLDGKTHRKQNNRWKRSYLDTKQLNLILGTWLRYRNINSQDSQGNFIGIWEPKNREVDVFERSYRQYCQHPPFIFEFGMEIVNPRRKILEDLLQRLPREEWMPEKQTYAADTNPYLFNPKRSAAEEGTVSCEGVDSREGDGVGVSAAMNAVGLIRPTRENRPLLPLSLGARFDVISRFLPPVPRAPLTEWIPDPY